MFHKARFLFFVPLAILGFQQASAEAPYAETSAGPVAQQAQNESYDVRLCSWISDESNCCQSIGCATVTDSSCCDSSGCGCECGCGSGCGCGCSGCGCGCGLLGGLLGGGRNSRASLWVWGGPSYGSSALNSLWGFAEGLNAGYRLTDSVGIYGSIGFNHNSFSTQILGTVGVQKFGDPNGGNILDRSSIWVMWDQATDTEISDLYLHQLRFMVGMVTGERSEIGMSFSIPTGGDDIGGTLSPLGGPGYLSSSSSFVGPYVKRRFGQTDLTGMLGYSSGGEGVALGVGAERRMTERLSVGTDFKFGATDNYTGSVYAAVPFGAADTKWR